MITELQELLFFLEGYCDKRSRINNEMQTIFRHRNFYIAIPAIIISTISGSGTISLSVHLEKYNILGILFGSMALIAAALFSVHRYLQLPELQKEYTIYSDEFEKLRIEIKLQLTLDRDEPESSCYRNLPEFAKESKKRLDILIDKSPAFFKKVEKRVDKQMLQDLN
jgi:hypothetical protein